MRTMDKLSGKFYRYVNATYPEFAKYCNFLERGQRKEALKNLNSFLLSSNDWTLQKKFDFTRRLISEINTDDQILLIITYNLKEIFLRPTLREMMKESPADKALFIWYARVFSDINSLKQAYMIDKQDDKIICLLLSMLDKELWKSTHHLPKQYLGNLDNDIRDLKFALEIINESDNRYSDNLIRFKEYRNLIVDFFDKNIVI